MASKDVSDLMVAMTILAETLAARGSLQGEAYVAAIRRAATDRDSAVLRELATMAERQA
jgi:hypothetical protein